MSEVDLEAMNKVRVAMGLKPIPIHGASGPSFKEAGQDDEDQASTLETREAAAGDNWARLEKERQSKEKRLSQKEGIRKAREAAQRNVKMTGTTMGDEDDDQDTMTWLKKQKKRRNEIEKKRKLEEEMAEREKALQPQYTAKDLAGVKVGHEFNQFEGGSEQILTLKDAVIGDESEDDELENVDMRADETLKKKLELKKKKPVYNPNDDDESGEKSILKQYDEELNGERKSKFTLDGFGSTRELAMKDADDAQQSSKGIIISLDILKDDKPVSDYVDISEIKIRKPKKKKSKSTRKKNAEDDDIFTNNDGEMDIDLPAKVLISQSKKRTYADANFVDDDDLQAKLAQQRREALKKMKRIRPEDIAKQLKEEEENTMDIVQVTEESPDVTLQDNEALITVLDETSEFISQLQPDKLEEVEERTRPQPKPISAEVKKASDDDGDVDMEESYAEIEQQTNTQQPSAKGEDVTTTGLDEESTIDQGIGATLAMLRQRRLVEDKSSGEINSSFRQHEEFLAKKRAREDNAERDAKIQRERDRQSGRLDRMSAREKEEHARQINSRREQNASRDNVKLFNESYKPNIELKYIDDHGRSMNPKEAFKHLSHQFHGKGSGKQKHEKLLKKIGEEKKREAMSTLDSSQHASASAMGSKAKKNQQAGVRLQ